MTMRPQTRPFDVTEMLQTDQDIAEYLTLVIEDGDPALLAATLGDIARARGMTQIARDAGIGREALYKALRPGAAPRFDTIARVCKALGVKLVAQVQGPVDRGAGDMTDDLAAAQHE
ncbi:MAG: addiction module antidote protein [Ottowia sp.]|nr:putative addiction module antidote protein [Ottowia sp.]